LVAVLPSVQAPLCLDLACGTGDIAFLLARRYAHAPIIGIDITDAMLNRARRRNRFPHVRFVNQDMGCLDFPEETFDIVTGGYALRNAPDLEGTITEICRVLKMNGVCAFVDFSKPSGRLAQLTEYWLLKVWTGFWGMLLHRNPEVYGYIAESLRLYPDRDKLRHILALNGLTMMSSRLYFFGIIESFVAKKTANKSVDHHVSTDADGGETRVTPLTRRD
jgi:demethylmenaquinone methyltransferase/2-methoxy-6-polyprenyl-1,4-benzoquinol methylase